MGDVFDHIPARHREFIAAQHVFFVATAPSDASGRVNLSPKGLDTLRVLDPHTVAYLDFVGSGVETIAHLRENGRIALMFCAFSGPPKIVRLHGRGEVIEPQSPRFGELRKLLPPAESARAVILVHVERASDSCGYGVPLYAYEGERTQLPAWAARKGAEGLAQYQREKNAESIDGLPGLAWVRGRAR
ncbi:MAG TPA: pyridoxamine 5'-phosphate oxidase family protein [Myxococcota bacterium]|nr:pyridoxamine 5'-phosphate oxidase family protein [Myxococcota bacterium]